MAICTRVKEFDCNLWPGSGEDCEGCEHEWDEDVQCPFCGAFNMPCGALGRVLHYTCRECGTWYAEEVH